MKVLIVSHNVFSPSGNMGKTLMSYVGTFGADNVAQLYIQSEAPTDDTVCRNYYRFTDVDAVKSIFLRTRGGQIFRGGDIRPGAAGSGSAQQLVRRVYTPGGKRSAFSMAARELVWALSGWNCRSLRAWLQEFQPDVVLYAAGDYGFSHTIAAAAAELLQIPLVLICMDDYYLNNRHADTLLGRISHRLFMRTVRKTVARSSAIFTICDKMAEAYAPFFRISCHTLHTGAQKGPDIPLSDSGTIAYIGNLGLGRHRQLMDMGRALQALNLQEGPSAIDVYSGETDPAILADLARAPGIRFHGSVDAVRAAEILRSSRAVIHTESFEPEIRDAVRYSVSTKIADTMAFGPCMIAYGPEDVASMEYLRKNEAAFVVTSPQDLSAGLCRILGDDALRTQITQNARTLARKNHRAEQNSAVFLRQLKEICGKV